MAPRRAYWGAGALAINVLFLLGCATTTEVTRLDNQLGELQAGIVKTQSTLKAVQNNIANLDNRLRVLEEQAQAQATLSKEIRQVVQEFRLQLAKQEEVLATLRQGATAEALKQQSNPTEISLPSQESIATTPPLPPPPPLSPDELYRKGYEAFTAKEYEKALDFLNAHVSQYPEHDLADNSQYWIGEAYYALQQYQQALDAFQKVLDNYPLGNKVADALLKRGLTLAALKEKEAALREFQKVIDRYPKSPGAQIARENIAQIQRTR
jgi:tol-pal system protein YbgF